MQKSIVIHAWIMINLGFSNAVIDLMVSSSSFSKIPKPSIVVYKGIFSDISMTFQAYSPSLKKQ
jgi:hypothetical protein